MAGLLTQHALRALNVPVLFVLLMLKLNVPSIARPITNWCVLADSLSEEPLKELCSTAWNGDLYVDLKAMTVHKFTCS